LRSRFLIDENLSVALSKAAHAAGFEAMHVAHLGLAAERDWDLLTVVRDGDWVLVTNNAVEFQRRYARLAIHAGVVFIRPSVRRAQQLELFGAALADIATEPDIVNIAVDVDYDEAGLIRIRRYALP
jgi:predicted nuclease of predicted toxin-antitoxin system